MVPPIQNGTSNLIRVLAGQDDTEVVFDDGTLVPIVVNLDSGQFADFFFEITVHVVSNKPVYVGQYGSGELRDPANDNRAPFFMQIIPTDRFLREHPSTSSGLGKQSG
ncbi:MAG TPA: hypothetical protein GXX29_10460 [Firmicutes bacterium]|nr:hypothetical protein [Bacillota bacterium]